MRSFSEVNLPPAGSVCSVCNNECILEALKCQKCKNYIHTDCTLLPIYSIVIYLNTRSQYTCNDCAKDQGDEQFAMVLALLEKEKELKLKREVVNNQNEILDKDRESDQGSACGSDSGAEEHTGGTAVQQVNNSESVQNKSRKTKVCLFYRQNRCRNGRRGKNCPYAHPNLCNKYKAFGRDPIKGCSKGNECPYLHPAICFGSRRKRECLDLECKKLHLKGTRRYPINEQTTEQATTPRTQQAPLRHGTSSAPPTPAHQTQHDSPDTSTTVNFLVQQIHQMQQVQQQIMLHLKATPCQWTHPLTNHIR